MRCMDVPILWDLVVESLGGKCDGFMAVGLIMLPGCDGCLTG